jgi:hypothetical protein
MLSCCHKLTRSKKNYKLCKSSLLRIANEELKGPVSLLLDPSRRRPVVMAPRVRSPVSTPKGAAFVFQTPPSTPRPASRQTVPHTIAMDHLIRSSSRAQKIRDERQYWAKNVWREEMSSAAIAGHLPLSPVQHRSRDL